MFKMIESDRPLPKVMALVALFFSAFAGCVNDSATDSNGVTGMTGWPSAHDCRTEGCTSGICNEDTGRCVPARSLYEACNNDAECTEGACVETIIGKICTSTCVDDDDCGVAFCAENACVPPCTENGFQYTCVDGRPLPCTDPVAQEANCNSCGCPHGKLCLRGDCLSPLPAEPIGFLPAGHEAKSVLQSNGYLYIATLDTNTPSTQRNGNIYVIPATGGETTKLVQGAGLDAKMVVDGDELFFLSARSNDGDAYKLERVFIDGTGREEMGAPTYSADRRLWCEDLIVNPASIFFSCGIESDYVLRVGRLGGSAQVFAESDSIMDLAIDDAYLYWAGRSPTGVQRRTITMATDVEQLAATSKDFLTLRKSHFDLARTTVWFSRFEEPGLHWLDWSTQQSSTVASGYVHGLFMGEGALAWLSSTEEWGIDSLVFMSLETQSPVGWTYGDFKGTVAIGPSYIYLVDTGGIFRIPRPDVI